MNDERTTDSGDFALLEHQLQSLRPAEVPDFVQARLQFELGKMQGRREARKAMFAYASAACLAVWAGTTWLERSKANISAKSIVQAIDSHQDSNPKEIPSRLAWTLDDIRTLVRYEAAVRGDARIGGQPDRIIDQRKSTDRINSDDAKGPWNRQRWMQELLTDSATVSG